MIVDPAWVLHAMLELEPKSPFEATFARTSVAIARAAERNPLPGQDEEKTASALVAVAWFESRFQIDAQGDCTKSGATVACTVAGAVPHSFCAMQVGDTNLAGYRTTKAEMLEDVDKCITVGLAIMRDSFRVCSAAPLPERLSWYAAGGSGCSAAEDPRRKSKHRMALAVRVYARRARATASATPSP